jgi:hypothetical protein
MMRDADDGRPKYTWALLVVFIASFLAGLLGGHATGQAGVKQEAIRAGAGYVDERGDFRWKGRGRP